MVSSVLAQRVFWLIADALVVNSKFPIVVAANKSFEQWINMEAYIACKLAGYECEPEARFDNTQSTADLVVRPEPDGSKVMVEVKIVGDYTYNKYLSAIANDYERLTKQAGLPEGKTTGLQIIVMYSAKGSIVDRETWKEWIDRDKGKTPWCHPTELKRQMYTEDNSCIEIWGWVVNKAA
jgi:hypothetical protein